jgi:hypothetical protein
MYLVLCLFVSLPAFGYPALGDRVAYKGETLVRGGEMRPLEVTKEVTGYNENTRQWQVKVTETRNGETSIRTEAHAELFGPGNYDQMIGLCEKEGGRKESLVVPAGKFTVCHILTAVNPDLMEETWYGDVPFGEVRKIETDFARGVKDTLELSKVEAKVESKPQHQKKERKPRRHRLQQEYAPAHFETAEDTRDEYAREEKITKGVSGNLIEIKGK